VPDKAVSLIDTACARVAISQHAVPAEVDDSRRRIEALETELEIIGREAAVGVETARREAEAREKLAAERDRLAGLEARWTSEKNLVDRLLDVRGKLRSVAEPAISAADPLNLAGVLTPGPKLAALTGNRVLYRDGAPVALFSGGEVEFLESLNPADQWDARKALLRGASRMRSTAPDAKPETAGVEHELERQS
jgi:hypothetical protein